MIRLRNSKARGDEVIDMTEDKWIDIVWSRWFKSIIWRIQVKCHTIVYFVWTNIIVEGINVSVRLCVTDWIRESVQVIKVDNGVKMERMHVRTHEPWGSWRIVRRIWCISLSLQRCQWSYQWISWQGSCEWHVESCSVGGILLRCWEGDPQSRLHPVTQVRRRRMQC